MQSTKAGKHKRTKQRIGRLMTLKPALEVLTGVAFEFDEERLVLGTVDPFGTGQDKANDVINKLRLAEVLGKFPDGEEIRYISRGDNKEGGFSLLAIRDINPERFQDVKFDLKRNQPLPN